MISMKDQSERSFKDNQVQLSFKQLLELSHYEVASKNFSKIQLGISDYDINLRQPSEFYVQRRRKQTVAGSQANNIVNKTADQSKTVIKSKVQNVKKNGQAYIRQSKLSKNTANASKTANPMNPQPQKQINVIQVKEVKVSKKKVQVIESKKQEDSDKVSNYTLKQFQKQRYIEQNSKKEAPKVYLSEFMKGNKIEKALQNETNLSKHPKTQRSSPIIQKVPQIQPKNTTSHQQSIVEGVQPQKQLKFTGTKSRLYQLPQNYNNHSKSKSRSKIKKTKQTSFIRKSPIKIVGQSEIHSHIVVQSKGPTLYHQYAQATKSNVAQKQGRPNGGRKKRINLKCEDVIPTQDFQGQISHLEQSNAEYNHKEQLQQFSNQMHIPSVQRQPSQAKTPQIEINGTRLDFFEIDMRPLNKRAKGQNQGMNMIEINSGLRSKQEHKVTMNPKGDNKTIEPNHQQAITQVDKPSPIMKSTRKKIFQQIPSKSFRAQTESNNIELSSLSEEQMKMLLGGKGNKYKQAIILEYIKENRRCMAT